MIQRKLRKNLNERIDNEDGFTLVELMIASLVFAVILTISMYGFAAMSRFYQRSLYAARTQQTARDVVAEMGATIQGTGGEITVGKDKVKDIGGVRFNVICVDTVRYLYRTEAYDLNGNPTQDIYEQTGRYVKNKEADNVLLSDTLTSKYGCLTDDIDINTVRVLLDPGYRLLNFNIEKPGADASSPIPIYNITMNLVYSPGDNDYLNTNADYYYQPAVGENNAFAACKSGQDREFCYTANISTTVTRRIGI